MKNNECEIRITSDSKSKWTQVYRKDKNGWLQITNGVYRQLTAEQLLSHILPLLSVDYEGGLKVSVVPDTVEEIEIKLTNEELDFPKYLYRSDDYSIFEKQEDNKYRMQMDIERDWVTHGYEYGVLMGSGFLPCTEDDFGWLKMKHEQYYDYLSWSSRNDGHGGCKGGTMEEYLVRFSDGKTYLKK